MSTRTVAARRWSAPASGTADDHATPGPVVETALAPRRVALWRRGWVRAVVTLIALVVALFLLRDQAPTPSAVLAAARRAEPLWVTAAVLAQLSSLVLFGLQQRRLLREFSVTLRRRGAFALAVSRTAMAIGLPAGSAVSAAYAFRHFRARGADRTTAATAVVTSNAVTTVAMLLLYVVGAVVLVSVDLVGRWGPGAGLLVVAGVALLVALALRWRHEHARRAARGAHDRGDEPDPHPLASAVVRALHRPGRRWPALGRWFDHLATGVSDVAVVPARSWTAIIGLSMLNWCADILCLLAVTRAFGVDIGLLQIGGLYLTVQVARQLPVTPGGVGLIEAGLLAGFAATNVAAGPAAAIVLGYRLLSCWLLLPIGLVTWWLSRRSVSSDRHDDPDVDHRSPAD